MLELEEYKVEVLIEQDKIKKKLAKTHRWQKLNKDYQIDNPSYELVTLSNQLDHLDKLILQIDDKLVWFKSWNLVPKELIREVVENRLILCLILSYCNQSTRLVCRKWRDCRPFQTNFTFGSTTHQWDYKPGDLVVNRLFVQEIILVDKNHKPTSSIISS